MGPSCKLWVRTVRSGPLCGERCVCVCLCVHTNLMLFLNIHPRPSTHVKINGLVVTRSSSSLSSFTQKKNTNSNNTSRTFIQLNVQSQKYFIYQAKDLLPPITLTLSSRVKTNLSIHTTVLFSPGKRWVIASVWGIITRTSWCNSETNLSPPLSLVTHKKLGTDFCSMREKKTLVGPMWLR